MRAESDLVLFLALHVDPLADEVFAEDVAFEEEGVVFFEGVAGFGEAAGHLRNFFQFGRGEFVEVFVHRFAGVNAVEDAVESGHEHGGAGEVNVRGRIRRTILDTFRFGTRAVGRDADGGATVTGAVGEVHRGFVAGGEALVAVDGRVADRGEGFGVFEDAADVVEGQFAEAAVFVAGEKRFAFLPKRLVTMHAAAVVAEERFRHEGDGFVVAFGDVLDDVLEQHQVIADGNERVKTQINFSLAGSGNFMVFAFDFEAAVFHDADHFVADVNLRVGRRDGEVAFFVTNFVAEVREFFAAAVPDAFVGINVIIAAAAVLSVADVVEDEKFGFGSHVRSVGNAGALQIRFGFLGDVTRVAVVGFVGDGVNRVGDDAERRDLRERIKDRGFGIEQQKHVAGFDSFPAADGGAVEAETGGEHFLFEFGDRDAEVLPCSEQVAEFHVHKLDVFAFT